MDKPEWCPKDIWCDAFQVASPLPIGELGQKTLAREVAKAILSAQSQAYINAARILERIKPIGDTAKLLEGDVFIPTADGFVRLSQAILQRKEEIGRN